MRRVYKYELATSHNNQMIDLPVGAIVLKVDEQFNKIVMWALIDTKADSVQRHFVVRGTGDDLPKLRSLYALEYHGSAKLMDGALIYHVFEVINR